jgi:hypothetical protein
MPLTDTLDQVVRAAAPITDDEVRGLTLDELERDLRAVIVAQPARAPRPRARSARRVLRWGLPSVAAVAAAVLVISLSGGGERLGTSPDRAWAAPALRVANAVPRLLVGEPGWRVIRADEFTVNEGEMRFSSAGRGVDLHWRSGSDEDLGRDRANSADELPPAELDGVTVRVFRYEGTVDDFTALWRSGRYTMELRTTFTRGVDRLTAAEYRRVLESLHPVSVDEWLGAMPPSVVLPAKTGDAVDAMLEGILVPDGFDRERLKRDATVRDRYQLGARVSGAVACAWIERWVAAHRSGDDAAAKAAVDAMQTTRQWPILREMDRAGDYPEVLWQLAGAMNGDGIVPAGRPMTVEEAYRDALGC